MQNAIIFRLGYWLRFLLICPIGALEEDVMKHLLIALVAVFSFLMTAPNVSGSAQGNARLEGPFINAISSCEQHITFRGYNFTPNKEVKVTSRYTETLCSGQSVSSGWTNVVATTDGNGNFAFMASHVGKGNYHYIFYTSNGTNTIARGVEFSTKPEPGPPPPPVVQNPPQSPVVQLGNGCQDNGNRTVTCTAIRVDNPCTFCRDPYVGIFTIPHGVTMIPEVRFRGRNGGVLIGAGHCGPAPGDVQNGFQLVRGCVHGIERAVGTGRDQAHRWTMTYEKP
jgi:hypothetical protein